jgi:hypothetical protein
MVAEIASVIGAGFALGGVWSAPTRTTLDSPNTLDRDLGRADELEPYGRSRGPQLVTFGGRAAGFLFESSFFALSCTGFVA